MHVRSGSIPLAAVLSLLAACAGQADERRTIDAPDVLIRVSTGSLEVTDSIRPGWRRVRVEEDGEGHIVVAFRLKDDAVIADPERFLQALDTASTTPLSALALGGPEVGDTGVVLIRFAPGAYVFGCVRRGPSGHRHAFEGEARLVMVSGEESAEMPRASDTVRMTDFAYNTSGSWPAGPNMLRIENAGAQDHQVRLARLHDGASLRDWLDAEGRLGTDLVGVARMGTGAVTFLPVDLQAGAYVLYCLIPDPGSGEPHIALGMLKSIRVAPVP